MPGKSSYPFGLAQADFKELLPAEVYISIQAALKNFCRKIKGYEKGIVIGLESKTSSPIRALRDETGKSPALKIFILQGKEAVYAGGIVSSAADGIKAALKILQE